MTHMINADVGNAPLYLGPGRGHDLQPIHEGLNTWHVEVISEVTYTQH